MSGHEIELSVVVPCYNEAEVLGMLRQRLTDALDKLGVTWEVLLVDDGSSDGTTEQLAELHQQDSRFKVVSFSRNFGHQAAVCAGLAYSSGRAVGIMDADLQDPPEVLAECLDKLAEGYDVVYAVRRKRKENFAKRGAYALFYRLLRSLADVHIPLDSGDFCVMNRCVVEVLRAMPEYHVFLRGMRAWAGFRQYGLEYEREARAAGVTKYPLRRLMRLAADGVFSFSIWPLRFATYLGLCSLMLAMMAGGFIILWRLLGFRFMGFQAHELPGWSALAFGMIFFSGTQLLILGIMGEYIGRIYSEVKRRPRWIVRETRGVRLDGGR